jgi:hypothetical protein
VENQCMEMEAEESATGWSSGGVGTQHS